VQVNHAEGVANRINPEVMRRLPARAIGGKRGTGERIGQPLSRDSTLIPPWVPDVVR